MGMIRRKPEAIVKAFEMDPNKKALYVEGKSDRLFLEYLFQDKIQDETIFFEIETVDIPEIEEGGNRERLMKFSSEIEKSTAKIKCFVDADFSRLLNEAIPKTIILTDFRDLEAYLYDKKYFLKFIKIGLKTDKLTPELIFDELSKARDIAILRVCSAENKLDLPFKRTNENFQRYYEFKNGLNLKKYIAALMQNCSKKHELTEIESYFNNAKEKYKTINDRDFLHGKDVLEIIKEIANGLNLKRENIDLIFWMAFDKADIGKYKALVEISDFLNK